jgi:hypothetical protein
MELIRNVLGHVVPDSSTQSQYIHKLIYKTGSFQFMDKNRFYKR